MKKRKRMIFFIILTGVIFLGFAIYALNPQKGGNVNKSYKSILKNSPNHSEKVFKNLVPTEMAAPKWGTMKEFFRKGINRIPNQPIPTVAFNPDAFNESKNTDEVKFSWFGHSSILLKMEGKNLLIDPVFSERVSMFTWMGPKRFKYKHQMTTDALPHIDAVLISHDHYDHLDYHAILNLKDKVSCFYVPLGLRAHLEKWGVDSAKIIDLDWWDEVEMSENLTIELTPSRHFTGRGLTNRMSTLWGGWVFLGKNKRVYFSGDSGYFDGFKEIGEKFGSFDLAFIECGQYNEDWEAIHMLPNQSVQAAADVNAKIVVPIHWGKFKLSLHEWSEPVEMFLEGAKKHDYKTLTPEPNEVISISDDLKANYWWRE